MQETLPGIERGGRKALGSAHRRSAAEGIMVENHNLAPAERRPMKISFEARANAFVRPHNPRKRLIENPFAPYEPAPGVLPEGKTAAMAMDDAGFSNVSAWGGQWGGSFMASSRYAEGQTFQGYPELALMARSEERRVGK